MPPALVAYRLNSEMSSRGFPENESVLSQELGFEAERLATRHGLAGPDALQIAAAVRQGVEEFYTLDTASPFTAATASLAILPELWCSLHARCR